MCTIMIIPGIDPKRSDKAWLFAKAARPLLTKENNDAFGYAALGPDGLFAERWTNVGDAFKPIVPSRGADLLRSLLGKALKTTPEYASHGVKTQTVHALILHARFATTGGNGVENAHPFVNADTALIHNGMIHNHADLTKRISTCDSEVILNEYLSERVADSASAMQAVADKLAGWYAVAVLAPNTEHGYVLDVFRSSAPLHAAYVTELDTVVFATKPHLIKQAAKACGFECGPIAEVPEEILIRINPYSGELISHTAFDAGRADAILRAASKHEYSSSGWIGGYVEQNGVALTAAPDGKLQPIQPDVFTQDDLDSLNSRFEERTIGVDEYIQRSSRGRGKRRGRGR